MIEWVKCEDWPGYWASTAGEVMTTKSRRSKILKPIRGKRNYLIISMWKNAKRSTKPIHRLIGETFIPNPKNKREINHKDGNKYNNEVSNLEWVTTQENVNHKINVLKRSGPFSKGQNHCNAKFRDKDIPKIRRAVENKQTMRSMAKLYHVSTTTIARIIRRETWGHIE